MESVQSDGEVVELYEPMEMAGGEIKGSKEYLDLDSYEKVQKTDTGSPSIEIVDSDVPKLKKKKSFICLVCGKQFSQNAGRYNHMKKIHNIFRGDKTNIRCLEKGCLFRCSYKEKLQLHLVEEHGFHMDITIKQFGSYSEFLRWKEEFEKQEKTRFVKKSGSRPREQGVRVVYFYCSRSGTPTTHNNLEKQNFKRKPSTKSIHHCTASITCLELASGQVDVKVCATHYGHDSDLQTLRLTQTDKIHIVEQLVKGVPRDVVLDNIRSSASSEVDRIHLITIKDVKNIEKAYRLNSKSSGETATSTTCNINSWVLLMSQSEHNPVAHFEEHGSSDLVNYDFTLVLMTVGQIEMAKKYGLSKIFYIPTYATNDNKYIVYSHKTKNTHEIHIATLIVADGSNDAVPIAFMISTSFNQDKYKLFFECVKRNVPELEAKAVLTDDQKDIFEAWSVVFSSESDQKPYYLWSNRFVDKDWRDNLVAIPNEEIQETVYEKLYSYLESTDELTICSTLKEYVDNELLTNPLTVQFGNHFASKYLGSEVLWAGCYGKKYVAVHAQLNMERLSNEIEEVVDRKHVDKRFIVRTVQDLLKLISDNQCHRQAKIHKQVQELPNHHKLALLISPEAISKESDTSWRVNSSKDPEKIFSIVTKQKENCCNATPCSLFCKKCGTCAHEFKCSCRLFSFDKTMCKHIHAVVAHIFKQRHFLASTEDSPVSVEKESAQSNHDLFWGRRKKKKLCQPTEINSDISGKEEQKSSTLDKIEGNKRSRRLNPELFNKEDRKVLPKLKANVFSRKKSRQVISKTSTETEPDPSSKEKELPLSDASVCNKKVIGVKRKRGRPPKHINKETEQVTKDQDSSVTESKKPHSWKVNILRKR